MTDVLIVPHTRSAGAGVWHNYSNICSPAWALCPHPFLVALSRHICVRLLGFPPPMLCLPQLNYLADLRLHNYFVALIQSLYPSPRHCLIPRSFLKILTVVPVLSCLPQAL